MPAALTLVDSARMRYLTGALMYFAQGIPYGLLAIAIPAWLASQIKAPAASRLDDLPGRWTTPPQG